MPREFHRERAKEPRSGASSGVDFIEVSSPSARSYGNPAAICCRGYHRFIGATRASESSSSSAVKAAQDGWSWPSDAGHDSSAFWADSAPLGTRHTQVARVREKTRHRDGSNLSCPGHTYICVLAPWLHGIHSQWPYWRTCAATIIRHMRIAILGCGLVGTSWAALFSVVGGHEVLAWDPSPERRSAFCAGVARAREQLAQVSEVKDTGRTGVCDDLATALSGVEWIQENAPESLELKHTLFGQIEALVSRSVIVASSTSSFTWSQLATGRVHPERFVTAHPFNPPHLIPLVELYSPERATLDRAVAFYSDLQRVPVCLRKEAVGHIGNRLASALWREAVHVVAEGIADVADVDSVLINGPGLRWSVLGTHLGYHLGGGDGGIENYLRHLGPSQERRWASLGQPKLTQRVCRRLVEGVHAEISGRTIAELERVRDEHLMQILRLRYEQPELSLLSAREIGCSG